MSAVSPKQILEKNQTIPKVQPMLSSKDSILDNFLGGGLRWGEISEWGIPWGQGMRGIIIPFLVAAQQDSDSKPWILWIYGQRDVCINPPAWHARGVELSTFRFTYAQQPVRDLRPLFLSPFFRIIIIDSVSKLNDDEYAFIARQARRQNQLVFILYPHLLSQQSGNIWAKTRINCWHDLKHQQFFANILKGRLLKQVTWPDTAFCY